MSKKVLKAFTLESRTTQVLSSVNNITMSLARLLTNEKVKARYHY